MEYVQSITCGIPRPFSTTHPLGRRTDGNRSTGRGAPLVSDIGVPCLEARRTQSSRPIGTCEGSIGRRIHRPSTRICRFSSLNAFFFLALLAYVGRASANIEWHLLVALVQSFDLHPLPCFYERRLPVHGPCSFEKASQMCVLRPAAHGILVASGRVRGRSGVESKDLSPRLVAWAAGPTVTGPRSVGPRCSTALFSARRRPSSRRIGTFEESIGRRIQRPFTAIRRFSDRTAGERVAL